MGSYEKYLQEEVGFWRKYLRETYEPVDSQYHKKMVASLKLTESMLDSLHHQKQHSKAHMQ